MLRDGRLATAEVAEYSGLETETVEQLVKTGKL